MIFFHLGRDKELCKAEIEVQVGSEVDKIHNEIVRVEIMKEFAAEWQRRLAGVVKISYPTSLVPFHDFETACEVATGLVMSEMQGRAKRRDFACSIYGIKPYPRSKIDMWGMEVKQKLKALGNTPVRYVRSKEPIVPSVMLTKEKVLPHGVEINFIEDERGWWVSRTLTVQDWKEWQMIDMHRPSFDLRSGILPVKVAYQMVNLAGTHRMGVLWDPYCGSGTIMLAAAGLGWTKIIGSDISPDALRHSTIVADWIKKTYPLSEIHVTRADAQIADIQANVIVTEPYLGPALHRRPTRYHAERIRDGVITLYQGSVWNWAQRLSKGGIVVMCLPAWVTDDGMVHTSVSQVFSKESWEILSGPLWHFHPDHFVRRAIYRIRKI